MLGSLFAQTGDLRRAELDVLHAVMGAAQLPCQRPDLPVEEVVTAHTYAVNRIRNRALSHGP